MITLHPHERKAAGTLVLADQAQHLGFVLSPAQPCVDYSLLPTHLVEDILHLIAPSWLWQYVRQRIAQF